MSTYILIYTRCASVKCMKNYCKTCKTKKCKKLKNKPNKYSHRVAILFCSVFSPDFKYISGLLVHFMYVSPFAFKQVASVAILAHRLPGLYNTAIHAELMNKP